MTREIPSPPVLLAPVSTTMDPLFPEIVLPDEIITLPVLIPSEPADADLTSRFPLATAFPVPLKIEILPPVLESLLPAVRPTLPPTAD